MEALTKWWAEFRDRAPLADEDMESFCCVVVGNKIDMIGGKAARNDGEPVSEADALQFLHDLVPPVSRPASPDTPTPASSLVITPSSTQIDFPRIPSSPQMRSNSIIIAPTRTHASTSRSPKHTLSKSRSRTSSYIYGTSNTTLSMYHTPSSSIFDVYQSARTSPEPWSSSMSESSSSLYVGSPPPQSLRARRMTSLSTGSTSSGSAATITPSRFAQSSTSLNLAAQSSNSLSGQSTLSVIPSRISLLSLAPSTASLTSLALPPPLEHGPKLFLTSAKTGEGVKEVFEYVAQRVVRRWEYDERTQARIVQHSAVSAADTIRLGLTGGRQKKGWARGECCGS